MQIRVAVLCLLKALASCQRYLQSIRSEHFPIIGLVESLPSMCPSVNKNYLNESIIFLQAVQLPTTHSSLALY